MNVIALAMLVCVGNASANTTPSADFDGDGIVGFSDFLAFVERFGSSGLQTEEKLNGCGICFWILPEKLGTGPPIPQSLICSSRTSNGGSFFDGPRRFLVVIAAGC